MFPTQTESIVCHTCLYLKSFFYTRSSIFSVLLETLILHGYVITFNICSLPSRSAMSYILYAADVLRILKGLDFNNDSGYLQSVQLPLSPYSRWLSWGSLYWWLYLVFLGLGGRVTLLVFPFCWARAPMLSFRLWRVWLHTGKRTCYNWIVSLDLHLHFHH